MPSINHHVSAQIEALLRPYPDLQAEFKEFRPDGRTSVLASAAADWGGNHKRKEASSSLLAPPAKRKKKVATEYDYFFHSLLIEP